MLAALAASGQSQSEFARTKGVGVHRVTYWRTKLDEGGVPQARRDVSGFVPLTVRSDAPDPERRVEVTLENGRRVSFTGSWDAAAIEPWLRALEGERCSG